jgi:ribokinase
VKPELVIAHLGIPRETVEQIMATANRKGVDTLLNPSPAAYLLSSVYKFLTHRTMNETEAAMLSGHSIEELNNMAAWEEAAEEFLHLGVKNVVITVGAKGAHYTTAKGTKASCRRRKMSR